MNMKETQQVMDDRIVTSWNDNGMRYTLTAKPIDNTIITNYFTGSPVPASPPSTSPDCDNNGSGWGCNIMGGAKKRNTKKNKKRKRKTIRNT